MSICEHYADVVRRVVAEWDGQDTEDLIHAIYASVNEDDKLIALDTSDAIVGRQWRVIAALENIIDELTAHCLKIDAIHKIPDRGFGQTIAKFVARAKATP